MEKQKINGGEEGEAKRFTRQKIFGTNSLQIGDDDASGLVGCIVEKGISEKPLSNPTYVSLPKPTVLPFPVARHRSHGPGKFNQETVIPGMSTVFVEFGVWRLIVFRENSIKKLLEF
ncbi:transcriptional elongation regulator MINIYO [Senna tora]|uniref:Transcriptional elongation regulator MINIYO n=1 Tax=Senna tora TaxID=362788 RepID=A0A834TX60_9FABA|nr:transcriptional elongation regulator MINIYO [Senna tora]